MATALVSPQPAALTLPAGLLSPAAMVEAGEAQGKGKLVGAVVQTVRLLRVLAAAGEPMGVSAAARAAQVNTSTAFNLLRTLDAEGIVAFDAAAKTYRLGSGLYDLVKGLLSRSLVERIRPEIARLADETGRLIALWEVMGDRVVLVDKALVDRPVRLDLAVTQRMPLMLGAVGRAAAARMALGDAELRRRFKPLRWSGEIDAAHWMRQVREAERLGYGVDRQSLYKGIVAIAAVITDEEGRPAYGVSAIEFANSITEAEIASVGEKLAALGASLSLSPRTLKEPQPA